MSLAQRKIKQYEGQSTCSWSSTLRIFSKKLHSNVDPIVCPVVAGPARWWSRRGWFSSAYGHASVSGRGRGGGDALPGHVLWPKSWADAWACRLSRDAVDSYALSASSWCGICDGRTRRRTACPTARVCPGSGALASSSTRRCDDNRDTPVARWCPRWSVEACAMAAVARAQPHQLRLQRSIPIAGSRWMTVASHWR